MTHSEQDVPPREPFPYVWVCTKRQERVGQRCRVVDDVSTRAVLLEFEDGTRLYARRACMRKHTAD